MALVLGVENSTKVITGVGDIICDLISAAKKGSFPVWWLNIFRVLSLLKIIQLIRDVIYVAEAIPGVLPELKDLDKAEIEKLTGLSYEVLKKIIACARA